MLIEIKSTELTNIETIKLIKRELFTARTTNKSSLKPLHKKLTHKLKMLAKIANGLTETVKYYNEFIDDFKDDDGNILFVLHHNICIKTVWDSIMATLSELFTSTGTISIGIEELKDLNWLDTIKLTESLGNELIA